LGNESPPRSCGGYTAHHTHKDERNDFIETEQQASSFAATCNSAPPTSPSPSGFARRGNIYFNYNLLSGCNYHRIVVPLTNMPADFDVKIPILFFNRLGVESHVIDHFRA
jgi:hypothetical protein